MFRFTLVALIALLAWCFWPVARGDFVIDDYVFLAQSRMIDAPWEAFWKNHFYEPVYFRPIGVSLWWIATRVFEATYAAHSVVNLVLHATNVVLLALLVRTLTERTSAALAAAALFALLPFSLAATLWPSNRFDLLAALFLLSVAHACLRFLRDGKPAWWLAAGAATLAACWSKELAFPVAAAIACTTLLASSVAWQRRAILFSLLGAVVAFAFFWRHWMLPMPYAAASGDVSSALLSGATAWLSSAAKLFQHSLRNDAMMKAITLLLLAVAAFATITAILAANADSKARVPNRLFLAVVAVVAASAFTQWPVAHIFAPMLDGGAFGTVTYARFYYVPTATLAVLVGLLLARARLRRSLSTVVLLCACGLGFQARDLSEKFASWTNAEIRPISIAATRVAEGIVTAASTQHCVVVLLGTQKNHPWFRQFADVTVKALTNAPTKTWLCQVLTESTPWIFISPQDLPLADLGLPTIPIDANRTPKPDYTWGGVRYRYRLIATDLAKLPHARFFEWNGSAFDEVTDAVRSGAKPVQSHGWGF
jgi:Dolichyl-phosphate-mannose-protein mannosyltransferase